MNQEYNDKLAEAAIRLAETWQNRANKLLTHEEKGIQAQMRRLLTHPMDKVVLTRMIDQSFRSHNKARVADQVNNVLREYGVPDFFSHTEKLMMQMFMSVGRHFPGLAIPKMIGRMRHDSSRAIIPGETEVLHAHLDKRKAQGVRMNINHLGEALLGEGEAQRRMATYLADLEDPAIEYISIKISTIYSQIQPLAFEHTVGVLQERLSRLYRTAARHQFTRQDGTRVPKFINLDMEEYRDLEITVAAFTRTLDQSEFVTHSAGIVLQAYLPDSFDIQRQLTQWARKRLAAGGSPIKLRIVKGANMEMEQLEASLYNWPLAPYDNKLDVDANYKRMVAYGMLPENIRAVNLGIASHNLFELAFAAELARQHQVEDYFYFEMLEGMADHVRRALCETSGDVLLYAPVAAREEFINAIGYLIRRLDENTGAENFLRYACNLKTSSPEWTFLSDQFRDSCRHMQRVGTRPHRTQDRNREAHPADVGTYHRNEFVNEPDTDWSLAANRGWAESIRDRWGPESASTPVQIPVVVAAEELWDPRSIRECYDLSCLPERICVARYALADAEDAERAVQTARADPDGWRQTSLEQRHAVLSGVARELRRARGDLIGAAAAGAGKVFTETDVEISEAIDFAEFYPFSARAYNRLETIQTRGRGVGLVVSPWNFPVAIPCGGLTASLAAGNTVIFKPASAAVLPAWVLCQAFWRAGVSRNVLQFVPCDGSTTGAMLVQHPGVDYVILTGGTDTGLNMLASRPDLLLAAETGGKNSTIVTAMSDRDQAIKNVVRSAFGNSGQKCSATSLLILETEVYDDPHFKEQLTDAARSFSAGSVWRFHNRMGPLIQPPGKALNRALTELEQGETWALKPEMHNSKPHLWTAGIKWDVQPGSTTHLTEFFGPLLGVMRAKDLNTAVELANQTGYGLTAGLESLDRREQRQWRDTIQAGNLYVNRGTTGAITLRQPFGGIKKSALGPGLKAGSPDYVTQFMRFEETGFPETAPLAKVHPLLLVSQEWQRKLDEGYMPDWAPDLYRSVRAIRSYLQHHETFFSRQLDFFHLRGQDNILRYLPVGTVMVRLHPEDTLFDVAGRIAAAHICGCRLRLSLSPGLDNAAVSFLQSPDGHQLIQDTALETQTDQEVIERLASVDRIRYAAPQRVPAELFEAAAQSGFYIAREPVCMHGRLELLHYLQPQSICDDYHRYGNLGERGVPA